jgi:hypothetical protein
MDMNPFEAQEYEGIPENMNGCRTAAPITATGSSGPHG